MPDPEAFVTEAQDGLGDLDLSRDLLALAHLLRAVPVSADAGWLDLRSPTRMATWFARDRNHRLMTHPLASPYRRRLAPGEPGADERAS